MRVLILKNDGTLDLLLKSVGADLEPGSSSRLADELRYVVSLDGEGTQVLAQGSLGDLIATGASFASDVPLAAQPSRPMSQRTPLPLYFHVSLPLDADNSLQNEQLRVQFTVSAEQARNNP